MICTEINVHIFPIQICPMVPARGIGAPLIIGKAAYVRDNGSNFSAADGRLERFDETINSSLSFCCYRQLSTLTGKNSTTLNCSVRESN